MAAMDQEGPQGAEGDDFIFNEYAMDDTLDPLQRLVKYHSSDFSLQRLVLIRELSDTAAFAGFHDTLQQLMPLLRTFVQDAEPTVRQVFAQQLHPLADYVVEHGGEQGYQELINALLPFAVELLVDKNVEVGAAALQTVKQLAGHVKADHVEQHILQVLMTLAKDERAEDYRVVAAQLFDELATKLDANLCETVVLPEVRTLSADGSFSVRRTVSFSLSNLCKVLGQEKAKEKVLPIYTALCRDDVWGVRKACAEAIVGLSAALSPDTRLELVPIFKALSEDSSRWVRVAAYQSLGQFIHTMRRDDITSMFLKVFTDMAFQSEGGDSDFAEYCAYSFPAVAQVMGAERWRELDDAYATLLKDMQWKVRKSLAHSLHDVATIVGTDIAEKSLTPALDLFLRDLDEVKMGAIANVDKFLEVLTPATRERFVPLICAVPVESENWRLRNIVAGKLGKVAMLVSPAVVKEHLVDLVLRQLEDSVQDVRSSTYNSAGAVLKRLHEADGGQFYEDFLHTIVGLASKPTFQARQMFLYIAQQVVELDAPQVAARMLEQFPALAEDRVPNVRFVLARVMANSVNNNSAVSGNAHATKARQTLLADKDTDVSSMAAAKLPRLEHPERASVYRPL